VVVLVFVVVVGTSWGITASNGTGIRIVVLLFTRRTQSDGRPGMVVLALLVLVVVVVVVDDYNGHEAIGDECDPRRDHCRE
jgi:hypothetical protein